MSIINQYSRIKHHTLTTPGATFSVPPQEDFTLTGTQSWNSNGSDLAMSEIGVSRADNKAYIRIGNIINELSLAGSTYSGNRLDQVLTLGNNTGTNNIIMGTATSIQNATGLGTIFVSGSNVLLSSAGNAYLTDSYLEVGTNIVEGFATDNSGNSGAMDITPNLCLLSTALGATSSANLTLNNNTGVQELSLTQQANLTLNNNSLKFLIQPGVLFPNNNLIQLNSTGTQSGLLQENYFGTLQATHSMSEYKTHFVFRTNDGTLTQKGLTVSIAPGQSIFVKAKFNGIQTGTASAAFFSDYTVAFRKDNSGTLAQVGSATSLVKTDFTGTSALNGVSVEAGAGNTVVWTMSGTASVSVNWACSTEFIINNA